MRRSTFDKALRLTIKFVPLFPSRREWQIVILLCSIKSCMSWIKKART